MKKSFWILLFFLVIIVAAAICAPWVSPYDPNVSDITLKKLSPSLNHLFGTDELGRDIFSRVLYGARVSLFVGLTATFCSAIIGTLLGLIAGFFRGAADFIIQMIVDLTLAFPFLLLAIGIAIVLPPGLLSLTLVLSLVGWAPFTRLIRGTVLELREREYVQAAYSLGTGSKAILFKHLLPNLGHIFIVTSAIKIGGFILNESALSFLGLGVDPSTPTWGSMVYQGLDFIRYQPWIAFFPGLAIFLTVSAFNLLGSQLQKD